jgi:HK97 family phage prohead protease
VPYNVGKRDACPASRPWAVYRQAEGTRPELIVNGGCHATQEEALAQMRALYAKETAAAISGQEPVMERGRLIVAIENKTVTDTGPGEITGLASVYGNVDLQDDIMERGALDRSIANHQGKAASKIPLLDWHGDSLGRLIGSAKELRSVPEGVWFKAGFSNTPEAQRARQLAQEGHLSGVSIGYLPIRQSFKTAGGKNIRVLHEVRLLEISLTPVPANPLAQVASVKAGDSSKPYGDVTYADPGYKDDGQKRYPIDTEAHCRAAWSYINMPKNQAGYTAEQVAAIKGRIRAALKRFGVQVSEAAALDYGQFADAMRKILEVPFEPARKAAADVLLDQYHQTEDEPDDVAAPADEPEPAADGPAPDPPAQGTLGTPDGLTPREYANMIANRGSTDGSPASLDALEAEIRQALEGQS